MEKQSLTWRIDGAIVRLLEDKIRFKEAMHGMGRIRQTEMRQCIGEQKIAEVVGAGRRGFRVMR